MSQYPMSIVVSNDLLLHCGKFIIDLNETFTFDLWQESASRFAAPTFF